tara:strand:- start:668 stop:799 length:132 start_codon:yes stop_codon:yes gene_type:complete
MKIGRKFGNKKKSKPQKGAFLVLLLVIVLFLWFKADSLIAGLF